MKHAHITTKHSWRPRFSGWQGMLTCNACCNITRRKQKHNTLIQKLILCAGRREKDESGGEAPFLEEPLGLREWNLRMREPRPPVVAVSTLSHERPVTQKKSRRGWLQVVKSVRDLVKCETTGVLE